MRLFLASSTTTTLASLFLIALSCTSSYPQDFDPVKRALDDAVTQVTSLRSLQAAIPTPTVNANGFCPCSAGGKCLCSPGECRCVGCPCGACRTVQGVPSIPLSTVTPLQPLPVFKPAYVPQYYSSPSIQGMVRPPTTTTPARVTGTPVSRMYTPQYTPQYAPSYGNSFSGGQAVCTT